MPSLNYKSPTLWIIILGCVGLLVHSSHYFPFFSDDAFISLRYAQRLIEGHGLTWNDTEQVEGYSNLLWTVCTAFGGLFGLSLTVSGRIVCVIGSIASIIGTIYYCRRSYPQSYLPAVTAAVYLASSGSLAVWTLGGLEATLHAALITWVVVVMTSKTFLENQKEILLAGLLLGLLTINRPDGLLICAAATSSVIFLTKLKTKKTINKGFWLCAIPILFFLTQTLIRLVYYGEWVPNTFHAKFAVTAHRFSTAINYIVNGGAAHLAILAPLTFGLITFGYRKITKNLNDIEEKTFDRIVVGMLFFLCWITIVFIGGGDIFPGWRHLVPVVPLGIIITCDILGSFEENQRIKKPELIILILIVLSAHLQIQIENKENKRAKTELYAWIGKITGENLRRAWGNLNPQPNIAVTSAGAVSFYSKLPALDMYGLNDRNITRRKNPNFGEGTQAHELMDVDYILDQKPAIIVSNVGGPVPEFGMINNPKFKNYSLIRFPQNPESDSIESNFRSHVWVRNDWIPTLLKEAPQVELKTWEYWKHPDQNQ